MTSDGQELFDALLATHELPFGPARTLATQQVVAGMEDADLGPMLPYAYHSLVEAYDRGGEPARAIEPFTMAMRLHDAEPDLFDDEDLHRFFWSYKWVVGGLWRFPDVPPERIERTLDDMLRRYTEAGEGLSAVHDLRLSYAIHRGDWAAAEELYSVTLACPRDAFSDCEACTASMRAGYHALLQRDAEALTLLEPIIKGGLTCGDEPHVALATALLPAVRTGLVTEARSAHLAGYRLVRGQVSLQSAIAGHLAFLARTGNEARALEVLGEHHHLLTTAESPLARLDFLAAAGLLLRRLAESGHGAAAVARAGGDAGGNTGGDAGGNAGGDTGGDAGGDPPGTVAPLAGWARAEALALAAAFDARNGTGWQTERALATLDAEPVATALRLGLNQVPALPPLDPAPPAGTSDQATLAPGAVGITAELIGAEGLDLTALATRAKELSAIGHPATATLWERVAAEAGPEAEPTLLAAVDDGIGRAVAGTDPFASRDRLREVVRRWEALDDPRELAVATSRAAVAAALTGDHEAAVAECADAGAVLDRLGEPRDRLDHLYRRAYIRLATAADDAGRAEAAALFRRHAASATELGRTADATQSRIILLDRLDEPTDPDAAAAAWQECAVAARAAGREWWLPHVAMKLAQARLAAGWFPDQADALFATLRDAVRFGDEWGDAKPAACAAYLRAELLVGLDRWGEAREAAFDAVIRAEDAGMAPLVTDARVLLGAIFHELERDHEAVEYLEAALPALVDGDVELLFRVRYRLGLSLRRLGEAHDAATQLSAASTIAEQAGIAISAAHAASLVGAAMAQVEPLTAASAFARAAGLFVAAEEGQGAVRMYRAQAAALAEAQQFDEALAALRLAGEAADALTPSEDVDPAWERAEVDDQSARVLAVAGRGIEAIQRALSAEQRHLEAGANSDAAYAAALAAQVTLDLLEDPAAAEPAARRAVGHVAASDDEPARTAAALALAEVLDRQGRSAEAAELRSSVGLGDEDDED